MKEVSNAVVVEGADVEIRDFDEVVTVAAPNENRLRCIFRGLQSDCRVVHNEGPAGLVDKVRMAKRGTPLEEQLRESDWELQKRQRYLKIAIGAVLKYQHFAFSKPKEARSCRQ